MLDKTMQTSLEKIIEVLNEFGGYFTFNDDFGREFVVAPKEMVERDCCHVEEKQLALPETEATLDTDLPSADEMLDKINRDIALYKEQQDEDLEPVTTESEELELVDDAVEMPISGDEVEPPRRVRFEPLRGDLPPELQE